MAVRVGQLEIDFLTNLAKFSSDMQRSVTIAEQTARKIQTTMDRAWQGIGSAAAGVAVGAVLKGMADNAAEAQDALAQVQASLRSTAGAAGVTEKSVLEISNRLKELTAVDDDAVTSMQSVLLTFTKVGKEVFPQAAEAIVDLSTKMNQDLKSSAVQVGKALNDPIKGMAALQRVGVKFDESQQNIVKNLVNTGRTLDAQKIILRELQTEFGGSAAAARDTLGGALKALEVRAGDLFQALAGEGSGLRYGVELLFTGTEKATAAVTALQQALNPSQPSQFTAALDALAVGGTAVANIFKTAGNYVIDLGLAMAQATGFAAKFTGSLLGSLPGADYVQSIAHDLTKSLSKGFTDWADPEAVKKFKSTVQQYGGSAGKDWIGDALKPATDQWAKWEKETQDRIAKIHKSASTAKAKIAMPDGTSDTDPAVAKKHADELGRQREALENILHNYARQAQNMGEITAAQRILNDAKEEEYRIGKLTAIPDKERLSAIKEIAKVTQQKLDAERQSGIKREGDALKRLLEDMQKSLQVAKDKNSEQEELIPLLEAESRLREIVKEHSKENLGLQEKIREVAKQQSAQALVEQHERALKAIKEITDENDLQNEQLQRQIDGQEELNDLLEKERKIRETKGLSDQEKDDAIKRVREQDKRTKDLNKTLANHKKVIDDITGSNLKNAQKVEALEQAYKAGDISAKEWADTMNALTKESDKAGQIAGTFASKLTSGLEKIITGGGKVKDVFADIGKEMIKITASKLFTEPFQKMLSGWAARIFGGGGGGATAPGFLPPGVTQSRNPYTGQMQYGYGGAGGGNTNPLLNPAMGYAGAPGIGGAIAGLGNLLGGWQGGMPFSQNSVNFTQGMFNQANPWLGKQYQWLQQQSPLAARLSAGFGNIFGNVAGGGLGILRALIPGFARGGTAPGGELAMFGEDGPELAVPKQDMHIFTAAQTRGLMSGWSSGVGSVSGSGWSSLSGGGTITPEEYLGDWVPQHRRQLLTSIGFSGTGAEVLGLMRAIQKEKNNYNKKALNEQLTNALYRRAQEWQGLEGEYREFARAANYAGAQKMVNEETAAGRGEGLAAMAGNAILSNNHFSHGIISSGRVVPPRGNAVEDILQAAKLIGRMPSEALLKHLAALDAEAQDDYMPGHFLTPSSGYKSMGMGGQGGGIKVYGYDDAYGGDGRQAAVADLQNAIRDESWANNAQNEAWRQISNKNPFGYGPGAAINGRDTVKFMGDPRKDTNGFNPYFSPPVMAPKLPPSMMPGLGIGPSPSGAHVPTQDELRKEFWNDSAYWNDMIGGNYMPQKGGIADYHRGARERLADFRAQGGRAYSFPAYPAAMGIAEAPPMMRGSLNPSRDVFADQFTPAPSRGNSTTWPYGMRTQSSSFDRFPTDPIAAGQIHVGMTYGGARKQGGRAERNTLYKVMESGDELFVPDSGGRIVPLPSAHGLAGGGGSPNVRVFPAPGVTTEVQQNGRDVTVFQRAQMANDLSSGTSGKQLQAAYGFRKTPVRRG